MRQTIKYFIFFSFLFPQFACSAGNDQGNGGNVDAQEVHVFLNDIVNTVESLREIFPEVDPARLRTKLAETQIVFKPKTFLNGVETDALNNGNNTIEINATRWSQPKSYNQRQAILLHELLGLVGLEINNYQISSRLLNQNRFLSKVPFQCQMSRDTTCNLSLSYDLSAKAFVISDANCGFKADRDYFFDLGQATYFYKLNCSESKENCKGELLKDSTVFQTLQFANPRTIFFTNSFGQLDCTMK